MKSQTDQVLDQLMRMIQVIGEDTALRQRFLQLAKLSPDQRSNEIQLIVMHLVAERKDPDLISVFRLFADARIYDAAMETLKQCGYIGK